MSISWGYELHIFTHLLAISFTQQFCFKQQFLWKSESLNSTMAFLADPCFSSEFFHDLHTCLLFLALHFTFNQLYLIMFMYTSVISPLLYLVMHISVTFPNVYVCYIYLYNSSICHYTCQLCILMHTSVTSVNAHIKHICLCSCQLH